MRCSPGHLSMWPSLIGPLGVVPDDGFLNLGKGAACLPTETNPGDRGEEPLDFFRVSFFPSVLDDVPAEIIS